MLKKLPVLAACLILAGGIQAGPSYGEVGPVGPDHAAMKSPARNGAYVLEMPGLVNGEKHTTISGAKKTIWDGIVIRQSKVRDNGTIEIPPGGIYTTVRCGNWKPFDNEKIYIGATPYYYINQKTARNVLHNVTFKKGEVIPMNPNKTRGWELSAINTDTYWVDGPKDATFKVVKSTGNYYGSTFDVEDGAQFGDAGADGTAIKAKEYNREGFYPMTEDDFTDYSALTTKVAAGGRSYVIVDNITPDTVTVKEMGTDVVTDAYVSPNEPTIAMYGAGDKFKVGNAEVEVTNVGADTVAIRLTEDGQTIDKTFGPFNAETKAKLFLSEKVRDLFWILSPSGKEIVFLNVNKPDGPFADGKASLVAYNDVLDVQDGTDFPADPRFALRPES